ncbi:hypothetical protein OROGR_012801 [Orobanche gracilis]
MSEESWSEIPSSIWASMNTWFTPAVFFVLLNLMIGTIALTSIFVNKKQNGNGINHLPHPNVATRSSSSVLLLQRLKSMNFYSQDPQISSVYKQTPDSDTHVSVESTHNLETQAQYFFEENMSVRDPQSSFNDKQTPDSDVHYFSQGNQQILQFGASNSISERAHEKNPEKPQAQFVFVGKDSGLDDFDEQAQEEKVEENEAADRSMDEVYSQLAGGGYGRTKSETEQSSGEVPVNLPARMRKSASLKSAFGHFEEEKIVEARRPETVREKARVTEGDQEVDAKADDFIQKFKQQLKLQRLDSIIRYKDMIGRGS